MSVTDITARIQQIQSQLAMLAPPRATTSTAFASALTGALDETAATPYSGDIPASGDAVVTEARKYLGLPYVWGGTDPRKGLDCSGLVQLVYKNLGYDLPRVSSDQARAGTPVASLAEAQPGDLLAWDNSSRNNGADHIAIYVGDGKMIEAPRTGLNVRIVDVPSTPDMIRRIVPADSELGVASRVSARTPYADLFTAASEKYGVPAALLSAVAKQESGYDPKAVSPAGAQGLMQLMPGTARGLGVTDSFDPAQAVDGAARMLRDLTNRFGRTDLALAAYNAGPGAVLKYDGIPPYPETRNYVRNVLSMMKAAS
ncbi:lytic transglycosylase [Nocardioides marmoriginsengisoli]|uniref:Lytic transglycosylase n=1 Tax=Nocardioides marmoriginsengisoli TaxID=661483 RepID=A0A3N0CGS1_9ACTN|nr:transglycosylase SLT domain-containing protein [Nocardioides marmoriginsengisoli]RNL62654.1 lytic transglycosylase [Nocardioides marmoriginsengisoli]